MIFMTHQKTFTVALSLAVCALLVTPCFPQEAARPVSVGRLVEFKLPSHALKSNLLGDPAEQSVAVYLPPSYDTSPTKRFPTLYLLHGFTGSIKEWTHNGYQGMSLQSTMDVLIKSGKVREMIVVVPNGANTYGGGFYTNSTTTGNWEDYLYRELVSYIDSNYRTLARPASRGIAGHSMGGYGSIVLGMKHPDVFSIVYALSPCCLGLEGDLSAENPAWIKTFRLTSREQLKGEPKSFEEFFVRAFVALSASFSPNAERPPFYADFPFQERDGRVEKNDQAYARWRSKMPLYMVDENKQNLLKLRGIFLDYGQNEEFSHIRITTTLFSKALSDRGIPHVFEIYEGADHGSKIRERVETKVLQFFSERFDYSDQK
nr:ESTGX3 [uncultured bacterium]